MCTVSLLCVSYRIVVSNEDEVLVLAAPYCALVQWVNDAHVRLLFEAQQSTLMELHTVTTIRTNTDHCPYYQSDLREIMQQHIMIYEALPTLYYIFQ